MSTLVRLLATGVFAGLAILTLGSSAPVIRVAAQQTPTFRSATDVIAVDVQVVDGDGQPIEGLRPEQFTVTINGSKRRVLSAALVGTTRASRTSSFLPSAATTAPPVAPAPLRSLSRTVMIAIDALNLDVTTAAEQRENLKKFIAQMPPEDQVGLFAFPTGPNLLPTTDRLEMRRAIDTIVGQKEAWVGDGFNLRPSEVVDLSVWADAPESGYTPGLSAELAGGICARQEPIANCLRRLAAVVKARVIAAEGASYASLSMLRQLFVALADLPGRKTVVLVSGGVLAADSVGGRPALDELSTQIGKAAAAANVSVYTLFLDNTQRSAMTAQTGRPVRDVGNLSRDAFVEGRWLERFAGISGGSYLRSVTGNSEIQLQRIVDEMSAYYLLAVEPAAADRDGRVHEMRVKLEGRKGATVRSRSWVVLPRASAAAARTTTGTGVAGSGVAPAAPPPVPRGVAESVKPLADAYGKKEFVAFDELLVRTPDLANVIRDYRTGDPPWANEPRRSAAFALELAIAGLFNSNGFARDEGLKLLAQAHTSARAVNAGQRPDDFECTWYWVESAALQGLQQPELGLLFIQRSRQRCATHSRLALAHAVLAEQMWRRDEDARQVADVTAKYDEAIQYADVAGEARARAAWFHFRVGNGDRAVELLNQPNSSPERQVRYLHDLIKGRVLQARGQTEAAAEAYRQALVTWPGAQSARVGLLTSLVALGRAQEAADLSEEIQKADNTTLDPWWTYWRGDFRGFAALNDALRGLAK
jgi:VWFA-related protein